MYFISIHSGAVNGSQKKSLTECFTQYNTWHTWTPAQCLLWQIALQLIFDIILCWNSWHSAPCVLANITRGAVRGNGRREERASGSSRGEKYHCKVAWLLTGLFCLVRLLRVCEVIVPTHCVLVLLFFSFSFGRWPGIGCTGYCTPGDSFWHCNCLLWARGWRV